ncbi:MAG: YjbF family lipoprotein [Deltaproteobacteria bacterium]
MRSVLSLALCAALLMSCGSSKLDKDSSPLAAGISQVGQLVKIRKAGGAAAIQGDAAKKLQAFVADAPGQVMIGAVEQAQLPLVLQPNGTNGGYTTWASPDKRSVTMYSGVISATRGYGGDVLAYDATSTSDAIRAKRVATYTRTMRFLGPQYDLKGATLTCTTENIGDDPVKIVDTERTLTHMIESCTDKGGGTIKSEYWVGGSGDIWQSRQWIGPQLGYIFLQRLK